MYLYKKQERNGGSRMEPVKKYNNWKATLAIAKASFRSILRSPSTVIFSLVFPLVFILVFGFIGNGGISLDVGVTKDCDKQNPIYKALENNSIIHLVTTQTENEMHTELLKGRIDAMINIQKNTNPEFPLYTINLETTKASLDRGAILKSILNNILLNVNSRNNNQIAEVKETTVEGRHYKTIDFILPGQLGFSLLGTGVFATAFLFLSLRITLVIKRYFATPVKKYSIIAGEMISRLIFSLAGALIIICIGHFFFDFTLINGITTVLNMLVISALGLIIFMGFGFVVSGVAKTESSVPPIANLITMPQFLLSGTFFSITAFPVWLQPLCKILPLTYINDALRKIAFEGAGLMDVGHQILIVALWGVGVYALAIKVFKWE
jgi:ABC-2 type transport system permease protein